MIAEQGSLAITARGDGSRWYGRLSIPESAAQAAGLSAGIRVSARYAEGTIIVQADELGRIRFPPARGKSWPRHSFEAATSTLGLREATLPQTPALTEIEDGMVRITVPEEYRSLNVKARRKPRRMAPRPESTPSAVPDIPLRIGASGAAAALVTEATRAVKTVRPVGPANVMEIVRGAGHVVEQLGPRLFRLDGATKSLSDMFDLAWKISGSTESNKIVIVLD